MTTTSPMKPSETLPFRIRPATSEDVSFLFSSWLKSLRDSGVASRGISNTIFFEGQHKLIEKILQNASVHVACSVDNPAQLYGYIVAEKIEGIFVMHYIYVKHTFRRMGIGQALLNSFSHDSGAASCATHLTRMGERLLVKYNFIYHPYLIMLNYGNSEQPEAADENT